MSAKPQRSVFYGWWIVAASFVGLTMNQSTMVFLVFGVFMKPLGAAFGWGRGPASLALSICAVAIAVMSPIVGSLVDRIGARRVMLPSMIGFGLLMCSLYFLTDSLFHFYAVYLLLGIVGTGANNVSYMRVISDWFGRRRGRALGIASSGVAMGSALASFTAQKLIDHFGWRAAYLGLGCFILFVGVPIVALIIRDKPSDLGMQPEPGGGASPPLSVRESWGALLSRPLAWAMITLGFLVAVSLHGAEIHMVPLLTDRGISPDVAAGAFAAVTGVCALVGRLGVGALFDYFFAPRVSALAFLAPALGLSLVLVSSATWPCWIMAALLGLGSGAESDVLGYLTSRYFGVRAFGRVYGCVFAGFWVGTAVGPYLFGLVFDWTHSYQFALVVSVSLILIMCIMLALMPRFPDLQHRASAPEPAFETAGSAPATGEL